MQVRGGAFEEKEFAFLAANYLQIWIKLIQFVVCNELFRCMVTDFVRKPVLGSTNSKSE
jgi:hypothetical protein